MPLTVARRGVTLAHWVLALGLMAGCASAFAQVRPAAEVVYAQGAVSAQRDSEEPRLLGKGSQLFERDLITTGRKGFVVMDFIDGGKMTLRSNSAFHITEYRHGGERESALLRLVRGGLRAVTGLIVKQNPDGYKIGTPVATIGVRGTDFDARLCEEDCAAEQKALGAKQPASITAVAARVVLVNGSVTAESAAGATRALALGAPVYSGDTLQTGRNALAVLAFRDDARVTLQPDTRFKVEDYRYDAQDSALSNMVLRLVRGSLRAVTGLIAKRHPQSFKMATVVGTIGIRGSGMDISCEGRCAEGNRVRGAPNTAPARGEGLFLHSWLGIFEVTFDSQSFTVNENQTAFFASGGVPPVLLPALPAFLRDNPAPRPDRVPVDLGNLFGVQTRDPATPGLYVLVRDGHVSLVQDGRVFDLGRGEAGYADPRGTQLMRLDVRPPFMEFDRFPRPDEFDDKVQRILEFVSGERDRPTGRGAECEVR